MAGNDTITLLARELGFVLQPFLGACVSSDDLLFFLNDLGWDFDPLPDEVDAIRTPALHLASLLPDDVDGDWPDGETLIAAVGGVFIRQINRRAQVVAQKSKIRLGQQMVDVTLAASGKIIQANNFACLNQFVAKMRADKTGTADNQDVLFFKYSSFTHST